VGIHAVDGQQGDQQSGGEPQPEAHHNEDQQELQDILVKDAPQEALQLLAIQVGDQQERDNSVALGLQHTFAEHSAIECLARCVLVCANNWALQYRSQAMQSSRDIPLRAVLEWIRFHTSFSYPGWIRSCA